MSQTWCIMGGSFAPFLIDRRTQGADWTPEKEVLCRARDTNLKVHLTAINEVRPYCGNSQGISQTVVVLLASLSVLSPQFSQEEVMGGLRQEFRLEKLQFQISLPRLRIYLNSIQEKDLLQIVNSVLHVILRKMFNQFVICSFDNVPCL